MARLSLDRLEHPIVQAPLAGGPSTPALAAAVCEAGGLGFLEGGYKAPNAVRSDIAELRSLTTLPFGLNLFAPPGPPADPDALERYAAALAIEAERYGVSPGPPREVHHLTAPLRAAAREQGDPDGFHLWAGQAHPLGRELGAGELVRRLAEEARAALGRAAER